MPNFQDFRLCSLMVKSFYECLGLHCLWFLLGLHPECSLSGSLSCCELEYLVWVIFHAYVQSVMAPVVRVEPCEMKLLYSNPGLLARVKAVGWLSFINRFFDSNPEVTRVFAMSLADSRVTVGDIQFPVDERSVALATGLPLTGERWFKYKPMNITEWR